MNKILLAYDGTAEAEAALAVAAELAASKRPCPALRPSCWRHSGR